MTRDDNYSRFEVVRAARHAYLRGWSDRTSFDIMVEKHGTDKLWEDKKAWEEKNPGKTWLWENPYEEEYQELKNKIEKKEE